MSDKRRVEVNIGDTEYVILTDDSEEHVRTIADHVDRVIRDLEHSYRSLSPYKVATLAAVYIADELYKTRSERNELSRSINSPNYALSSVKAELAELHAEHDRMRDIYQRAFETILEVLVETDDELGDSENFNAALGRIYSTVNRRRTGEDANQLTIPQLDPATE